MTKYEIHKEELEMAEEWGVPFICTKFPGRCEAFDYPHTDRRARCLFHTKTEIQDTDYRNQYCPCKTENPKVLKVTKKMEFDVKDGNYSCDKDPASDPDMLW